MSEDRQKLRQRYLAGKKGDLTSYAGMIGEEFSSKVNRLSQILGTAHELSTGEYKESLLRRCIEKFIPKRYSVGTGFIIFVKESPLSEKYTDDLDILNLKTHYVSHQIDIIVFDDTDYPPIFRDRDFVVLRPESVKAIIEVKGFLNKTSLVETIRKYISFGFQWNEYNEYCLRWGREKLKYPALQLMAWDIAVAKNGRLLCNGKMLRKTIVETYRNNLTQDIFSERKIPIITAAYIYKDCIVHPCDYATEKKVVGFGYSTTRGQFVRYSENGKPFLDGDSTISSLLASVHLHLDTPFNPDFSYLDQSFTTSLFPHKYEGITDWVSGEDVDMAAG